MSWLDSTLCKSLMQISWVLLKIEQLYCSMSIYYAHFQGHFNFAFMVIMKPLLHRFQQTVLSSFDMLFYFFLNNRDVSGLCHICGFGLLTKLKKSKMSYCKRSHYLTREGF